MIALILILFSSITNASAEDDHCIYFKYCGNASQSSTSQSMPSTSTSANFNPSNISNVKGLGLELLLQPNNPLGYNLVTGNGKIGGALITPTAENSFFGNRAIELDFDYLGRRLEKLRYRTKKINIALGGKVITTKNFALDLGISLKRNPDVKKINPGVGLSVRLGFLNFGAYVYKDDTKLDFRDLYNPRTGNLLATDYNAATYQETFTVTTASLGVKFGNLALDAGMIKSKYAFYTNETSILIYSSAYNYGNFLFNLAYRQEESDNMKEDNGILSYERKKSDFYTGVQYLWNKHLTTGIAYNNFLVHDISMTLTLFL